MMTQQLPASILTAPLAQIDRRSLSQAWYSALHLARTHATPAIVSRSSGASRATTDPSHASRSHCGPCERTLRCALTPAVAAPKPAPAEPTAQPRTRSLLARQIERAFRNARKPVVRSTLTLGRGEGRAYVVLQSNGSRMRLIAVCRPGDRQRVARALEEARCALAAHGCALHTDVEAAPCS